AAVGAQQIQLLVMSCLHALQLGSDALQSITQGGDRRIHLALVVSPEADRERGVLGWCGVEKMIEEIAVVGVRVLARIGHGLSFSEAPYGTHRGLGAPGADRNVGSA